MRQRAMVAEIDGIVGWHQQDWILAPCPAGRIDLMMEATRGLGPMADGGVFGGGRDARHGDVSTTIALLGFFTRSLCSHAAGNGP